MHTRLNPVFPSWRQTRSVEPKEHVQVRKKGLLSIELVGHGRGEVIH
jgi:hypothetical protein